VAGKPGLQYQVNLGQSIVSDNGTQCVLHCKAPALVTRLNPLADAVCVTGHQEDVVEAGGSCNNM
jgi:hypothetical protein